MCLRASFGLSALPKREVAGLRAKVAAGRDLQPRHGNQWINSAISQRYLVNTHRAISRLHLGVIQHRYADTPYSLAGNYLCLPRSLSQARVPGFRHAPAAADSRSE
jgi:hypothetical protein